MLASVASRRQALEDRFPVWVPAMLHDALDAAAVEFGDRPFVITDERVLTYAEIADWSRRIAAGLVVSGVRPGDNVAVVMANYPEFVAVSYAISRAGATAVPINFLNRRREFEYVLRQSDSVLLVTMDHFRGLDYLGMLDELAPGWPNGDLAASFPTLREVIVFATGEGPARGGLTRLDDLIERGRGSAATVVASTPSAPAAIPYTSGTTGSPKGVLLTHEMFLRTAYGAAYSRAFQDGRKVLFSLPLYHIFGYVEGLLAVPWVGGAVILQRTFDPVQTLRAIERYRSDDAMFVPTMTFDLLEELRRNEYDLSSLTGLFASGGYTPDAMWQQIVDLFQPEELFAGWGMTETTATTTCTSPGVELSKLRTTNGRPREVGVAGDPDCDGHLALHRIVDVETGAEVPTGQLGELRVRGPGVTAGYYNKPEETAAAFDADGWVRTGDLGRFDADGYFTLAGRLKESYRCGGEQVMPKEIEDVLTAHPAVAQAFVVPLPDERMGEIGVAWIVFRVGQSAPADELIDYCREQLARFKVPRHILPIAQSDVPTTATGRPRKFLLSERAQAMFAAV